jgi:hypothetical protein
VGAAQRNSTAKNIYAKKMRKQDEFGGESLDAKIGLLLVSPYYCLVLRIASVEWTSCLALFERMGLSVSS